MEALFLIAWFLAGYFALRLFFKERLLFIFFASLPFGMGLWVFSYLLQFVVFKIILLNNNPFPPILFNINWVISFYLSTIMLLIYFNFLSPWSAEKIMFAEMKRLMVALFFLLTAHFVFDKLMILAITGDSLYMLNISGDIQGLVQLGFPSFNLAIQSIKILFDKDFIASYLPMTFICLLGMMGSFTFTLLKDSKINLFDKIAISLIPPLLLSSTASAIFHAFYLNHHVISACFVFLSYVALSQSFTKTALHAAVLASITLLFFTFARFEAALFAVPLFFQGIELLNVSKQQKRTFALCLFISIAPWQICLAILCNESAFISNSQFKAIIFLLTAALFIYWLRSISQNTIFYDRILSARAQVIWIFAATSALFIKNYDHMQVNVSSILSSMFKSGGWNYIWLFAFFMYAYGFIKKRVENIHLLALYNTLSAVFIILAVGYFRIPYTGAFAGSDNRMLMHFIPLFITGASLLLIQRFSQETEGIPSGVSPNN